MSEKIFKGRVVAVLQKKEGVSKTTGNTWVSQDYVVEEVEGMYPKKMAFTVFGQEKIDNFAIKNGEVLDVHYEIDAKEWQGRWFNSITAWKVEREENIVAKPSDAPKVNPKNISTLPPINPQPVQSSNDNADDLPF